VASEVLQLLARAEALVAEHRADLDALNVFPVPDGDTGGNLLATLQAAHTAASAADGDEVLAAAVDGAVRGARGNSGVLLSQVLRGLLGAVQDAGGLDAAAFAAGLERADGLARAAVGAPVEGSLLSAVTAAAEAAGRAAPGGLVVTARAAADAAHEAVERTPSQLDVLARAGVVDAGARGLALVLEAIAAGLAGQAPAPPTVHVPEGALREAAERACGEGGGGRFEVMYLVEHPSSGAADELRTALADVGDSVAVVDGSRVVSVHVHTDDIGAALQAGLLHGAPSEVRVEDLRAVPGHAAVTGSVPARVVAGIGAPGLERRVADAGGHVLALRPGDLPSVAAVLDAVGAVDADPVVVLPGHRDVVPVARQAADVARAEGGRRVEVVDAATSAPAVLAALAGMVGTPDADVLRAAAEAVRCGEVVAAVRDAETPAGPARRGDWLAVVEGTVVAVAQAPLDALAALLDALQDALGSVPELVQLHLGGQVVAHVDGGRRAVVDVLDGCWPDTERDVLDAQQRPALLVVGVE